MAAAGGARGDKGKGLATAPDAEEARKTFDEATHNAQVAAQPWKKDPHYFKNVKVSALALLKMVMHARSGGSLEVMGLLQGKIDGQTMIVMDAFALPVEGSETRVNAMSEANEYMVSYIMQVKEAGRRENILGWYHSHPGYGCWLSGIDVATQLLNQTYQEPFLAVVIDPVRTMTAGKVEIGAFRTYPEGYKPPDEGPSQYQTIPMSKIEDFGVHCKASVAAARYYPLEMAYFKSSTDAALLDLLWNKYWVSTLSTSPLLANRDYLALQIHDLAEKLEQAEAQLSHNSRASSYFIPQSGEKKEDTALARVQKDSNKVTLEHVHGLMSQVMKTVLFNISGGPPSTVAPME